MDARDVSVYTSDGSDNDDPYSEVEVDIIGVYRFTGDDHEDRAIAMANELDAVMQKYRDMEVR
jgi:hypothetical protein